MTCVTGHLTQVEFTPEYKNWSSPPPEALFSAPIITSVHNVRFQWVHLGSTQHR